MSDLIRRQDAIDALKKYEELESNNFTDTSPISMMTVATIANCIEAIIDLPSAESERKKGEWIGKEEDWRKQLEWDECSECGFATTKQYNFCPNCGVEMTR